MVREIWHKGSNPFLSAKHIPTKRLSRRFFVAPIKEPIKEKALEFCGYHSKGQDEKKRRVVLRLRC